MIGLSPMFEGVNDKIKKFEKKHNVTLGLSKQGKWSLARGTALMGLAASAHMGTKKVKDRMKLSSDAKARLKASTDMFQGDPKTVKFYKSIKNAATES